MLWSDEVSVGEGGTTYETFFDGNRVFEAFYPNNFDDEGVLKKGREFFAKVLRESLAYRP